MLPLMVILMMYLWIKLAAFETNFHRFMEANHPEIGKAIAKEKDISAETEEALKAAIAEFKQSMKF